LRGTQTAACASPANRARNRRSGQMLIFVTLSLSVLIAMIGLAVDLGYSYYIKTLTQVAADSAAQAAAVFAKNNGYACGTGITCGTAYNCASPPTTPAVTPFEAGCLYAKANGFVNTGSQTVSFIANNTATPNESTNTPSIWIQANVAQTVGHWFLYGSGFHSGSVASQAIAGISTTPAPACLYILSPTAAGALTIAGGSGIVTSGCGVYVNSNSSTAINLNNDGDLTATGGGVIDVVGRVSIASGSTMTPTATTFAGAADPLANLAVPTVSSTCDHTGYSLAYGTATISPGVYCGGITAGGGGTLTMSSGLYIMNGGGFNNGNGATINGTGVTIYLTGQHGYTAAGMQLEGGSTTNLTAPSSGSYMGILFYQDRSATYATANDLGNGSTLNATGTLYFKTTALTLEGGTSSSKWAIVANTLSVTNGSTYQQDTTGTYTGLASTSPRLIQ